MGFLTEASSALLWSVGGVLLAVGASLLLWSLFADRARGRKRCPRCWYDMSASPARTCSECGRAAFRESAFSRTRRRWRWAALAAPIVLAGAAIAATPTVRDRGIVSFLPTFILVKLIPKVGEELTKDPTTGQWIESPICRELQARIAAGRLSPAHWGEALRSAGTLQHRERWPKDVPYVVGVQIPSWAGRDLTFKPRDPSLAPAYASQFKGSCGNSVAMTLEMECAQTLGLLKPGTTHLVFDIEIGPTNLALFSGTNTDPIIVKGWSIPVQLVDSADQIVPVSSDISATPPMLTAWSYPASNWNQAGIGFALSQPPPLPPGLGFSWKAELVYDGVVQAATFASIANLDPSYAFLVDHGAALSFPGNLPLLTTSDLRRWTLRLIPDPQAAITSWGIAEIDGRTFEYAVADCFPPPPSAADPVSLAP